MCVSCLLFLVVQIINSNTYIKIIYLLDASSQFNHESILEQYLEQVIIAGSKYCGVNSWTKTDANEEMAVVLALRFLSLRTDGDLLIIFGNPNVFNSKYRLHVKAKRGSEKKVKTSGEHTNSETYFENAIQYATAHQGAHSIY